MKDCLLAIDDQRMPRIVAPLKSDHDFGLIGQQINDLAFPFIAPLGAEHYHMLIHRLILPIGQTVHIPS